MSNDNHVIVGKIISHHGIKGWLTIRSFTKIPEEIFKYDLNILSNNEYIKIDLEEFNIMPKKIIMKVKGFNDIESTSFYLGKKLTVAKENLPKTKKDEYYWHELIGLNVMNSEKRNIGIVDGLFSSGDNDVLIVKNDERKDDIYIPCTKANIIKITTTYIQVRWDNEI